MPTPIPTRTTINRTVRLLLLSCTLSVIPVAAPGVSTFAQAAIGYVHGAPTLSQHQYYDYNGTFTGASTSTFRSNKRPRNLTEEEAAAITRNFSRGDFFVGTSAPVRIDPRLPVRLTLGEGDHVHFSITETLS